MSPKTRQLMTSSVCRIRVASQSIEMLQRSRRAPTPEELSHVEAMLRKSLPPIYRRFIQEHNGGNPDKPTFRRNGASEAFLEYIYPIGDVPGNLAKRMLETKLPLGLISIGKLGDGGRLCLQSDDDRIFIWHYDAVDEEMRITPADVEEAAPDIFSFFAQLEGEEALTEEDDPVADLAASGDIARLNEYVIRRGSLVGVTSNVGFSLLQEAILHEDFAFLESCLQHGAPMTRALHMAAQCNLPDAVEWLLSKGADINELDESGNTPLDVTSVGTGAELVLKNQGARRSREL